MSTHVRNNLASELPAEVREGASPAVLKALEDPQILLSPQAMDRVREGFAEFGTEGAALFEATIGSMRSVLADGLGLVFLAALIITVAALAASVFLKEIPLKGMAERFEEASRGSPFVGSVTPACREWTARVSGGRPGWPGGRT